MVLLPTGRGVTNASLQFHDIPCIFPNLCNEQMQRYTYTVHGAFGCQTSFSSESPHSIDHYIGGVGHSWAIWEPILATQDDFKSLWRKSILCTRALSLGRSLKPRQGSKAQGTTVATLGIDPHVFGFLGGTKLKPFPYPGRGAKNFRGVGESKDVFFFRGLNS